MPVRRCQRLIVLALSLGVAAAAWAEGADDLRDIGAAALTPLDLQGADPGLGQLRNEARGIEADRVLEDMPGLAARGEAALAKRRIGRGRPLGRAVDGEPAKARGKVAAFLRIGDMACGRTDAVHVGRFAGGIGRQRTAPLGHHAEAAEDEDLGLHVDFAVDRGDFLNRENAGQHHAAHAEGAGVKIDRIGIGGGGLYRKMAAQ